MYDRFLKLQYRIRSKEQEAVYTGLSAKNEADNAGLRVLLVRNAVVVEWPYLDRVDEHQIPGWLVGGELVLVAEENGGYDGMRGMAEVFCGVNGEPLSSISDNYGIFIAKTIGSVAVECVFGDTEACSVYCYSIAEKPGLASILRTPVVEDAFFDELGPEYRRFKHAVHAAMARANCYQCRHIHYLQMQDM